jgi:hypothetical protein
MAETERLVQFVQHDLHAATDVSAPLGSLGETLLVDFLTMGIRPSP